MKEVISFLKELKKNNNKEWFNENKAKYENARERFLNLIEIIISEVSGFDKSLGNLSPKETLFRIYRDTRFSKDKTPYKTNMGAYLAKGGRKGILAGYYIHIEPGKSFAGGGVYMPDKDVLSSIRHKIYSDTGSFKAILNDKKFAAMFELMDFDKLKRPPKGFDPDFPDIELIKFKSYAVGHNLTDAEISSKESVRKIMDVFKTMYPFNNFLNQCIDI